MSDNKKYYYIKLKDNYFDQDNIKVLESVPNGHIYSLIVVKLYLKATKYGGQLRMTESIPYDPKKIDILASVLNHDVAHVKEAIRFSNELGIISILDTGDMWMSEIQNFIGHSSSEADRKRAYRSKIKEIESDTMGHLSDERPPKIEIEIELEREKELELKPKVKTVYFSESHINDIYAVYPVKKGKADGYKKLKKIVYSDELKEKMIKQIEQCKRDTKDKQYHRHFSSWVNQQGWEDLEEVVQVDIKVEERREKSKASVKPDEALLAFLGE